MIRCKYNEKGSFTVEAAIIFPVILLFGFVIIYLGLLLYQYTFVQAIADRAAECSAIAWTNPYKSLESGKMNIDAFKKKDLYSELFDADKEEKLSSIKSFTQDKLNKGFKYSGSSILQSSNNINVKIVDFIIYEKITINIESVYKIPAGKIFSIFGFNSYFTININSDAVVSQPTEFIRNTDLVIDIEKDLESTSPTLNKLGKNAREIISNVQSKAFEFFNK